MNKKKKLEASASSSGLQVSAGAAAVLKARNKAKLKNEIKRHAGVYMLGFIPLVYYIIFKYVPIWNAQIAFKDFMAVEGVLGSSWVGLKNFKAFFHSFYFWQLIRNTVMYSVGKLIISLPLSIILAICIYECTRPVLRKIVQTLA